MLVSWPCSCRTSSRRCRHKPSASCFAVMAASRRACREDESSWDACSCCCSCCWSSLQASSCCLVSAQQGSECQGVQQGRCWGCTAGICCGAKRACVLVSHMEFIGGIHRVHSQCCWLVQHLCLGCTAGEQRCVESHSIRTGVQSRGVLGCTAQHSTELQHPFQ